MALYLYFVSGRSRPNETCGRSPSMKPRGTPMPPQSCSDDASSPFVGTSAPSTSDGTRITYSWSPAQPQHPDALIVPASRQRHGSANQGTDATTRSAPVGEPRSVFPTGRNQSSSAPVPSPRAVSSWLATNGTRLRAADSRRRFGSTGWRDRRPTADRSLFTRFIATISSCGSSALTGATVSRLSPLPQTPSTRCGRPQRSRLASADGGRSQFIPRTTSTSSIPPIHGSESNAATIIPPPADSP